VWIQAGAQGLQFGLAQTALQTRFLQCEFGRLLFPFVQMDQVAIT